MRLKRVEIQGFKSFPDKTVVEIREGITAIVGPNGSGKSNISDAIRWVLGEQSVRNLRGNKMEDVIFSGTNRRKPLGFAEVTITFDNQSKIIPTDYSEVAITRRMFRSGESEYYINKNSCRLRDIRELFMDTGVGKDGYSIIGQGRIEEILSNRPEDRRSIFEEAAGIVKYKTKKEETERKLERTEGNLIRIKDLIYELSNQLEVLEGQASRANSFTQLYGRLKELEINLYIRDVQKINLQINEIEESKIITEKKIEEKNSEKESIENKFNTLKAKMEDLEVNIENYRSRNTETLQELDKNKNELAILHEGEKYINKDLQRLLKEKEVLNLRLNTIELQNGELDKEIELLEEEYRILVEDYKIKDSELLASADLLHQQEEGIEIEKNNIIKIYNSLSEKKSELNSLTSFNENIEMRVKHLKAEENGLIINKNNNIEARKELDKLEEEIKQEVKSLEKDLKLLKEKELEQHNINDRISKEINQNNIKLQGQISSLKLLENMESDYEGYFKGVKSLLKASEKDPTLRQGLVGVVANLIKVEEKYERAIDISLGSNIQNIVTDGEEDAKKMITYLKKYNLGRITCLPLSVIKGNSLNINKEDRENFNVLGLGHELIDYDKRYDNIFKYLLGRTVIVENIDYGIKLANRYKHSLRIVTLDGEVLNPGGSMTGGSHSSNSTSIMGRKNKIKSLTKEINKAKEISARLTKESQAALEEIAYYKEEIRRLEELLSNGKYKIINTENEKNKYSNEIVRIEEQINRSAGEIKGLEEELVNYKNREETLIEDISQLDAENERKKNQVKDLVQSFNKDKAAREEEIKVLTDIKVSKNAVEGKIIHYKERYQNNLNEIINIKNSIGDNTNLSLANNRQLEEVDNKKLLINKLINEDSLKAETIKLELDALIKSREVTMKDFYQEQDRLRDVNSEISLFEKEINNQEVKLARITIQLENYHKKMKDEYDLDYEMALTHEKEITNLQEAIIETRRLKVQIKELGTVNLSSIEEYKTLKERLDFILEQQNDLLTGKENLREVIRDLEEKMTKQFIINFEEINKNFQEIFKILFDGGQAKLVIEDMEDVLNSGIDIQAQPPGKALQSLTLLSGGEKSLTAVALLFAILRSKPSPFCILDEIDAALDEANISRYTGYLKTFCNETQFILITHRKTTMEIADILYGVTMEEEGISNLISVRLQDYIDEIAS